MRSAAARVVVAAALLAACDPTPGAEQDAGVDASRPDASGPDASGPIVVVLPDDRTACADRDPLRRPLFGDLHVHTALSFDAAAYDVRTRPDDAYRFARGEEIGLPPYDAAGEPTRRLRLSRPLDFAAVTDHSEFLAETWICNDPSSPGYESSTCRSYRMADVRTGYGEFTSAVIIARRVALCRTQPELCGGVLSMAWQEVQDAAEAHYDRDASCAFTTFVAYEWTGTATGSNLHRNIIFRGRSVPRTPTSFFEASTPERLWDELKRRCLETGTPCDVLSIPHNGNLSAGQMFVPTREDGSPIDLEYAERRSRLEPLLEIYQHKGASECVDHFADPLASEDELCRFEELHPQICRDGAEPPGCATSCEGGGVGFLGGCVAPSDFARGALRLGVAQQQAIGANPFMLGFIGSTDTHQSLAGGTQEASFRGHLGDSEDDPEEQLAADSTILIRGVTASAGGLAVVWAEENSRESIFDALRRRETYATSGTRITVRMFGGPTLPAGLCGAPDLRERGYALGVPMGGEIAADGGAPRFVVSALRDTEGAPLAAIQIIKVWVEADGSTAERVYEIAGDVEAGSVDVSSCVVSAGSATDELCGEWVDPDYVSGQAAAYYARVIEAPSCRWSRYVCMERGVDCATIAADDPLAACCPLERHVIRERAWTSPICSR